MRCLFLILLCLALTGCSPALPSPEPSESAPVPQTTTPAAEPPTAPPETTAPTVAYDPIGELMGKMSLEDRIGQLFLARCEDSVALEDVANFSLGGFVLFGPDFRGQTPDSLRSKLTAYQEAAAIPLLIAVDEEGGTVTRVSCQRAFRSARFPSPREAFHTGGMEAALAYEEEKAALLTGLGINVNLGPVCDITTDPAAFLYPRSLGQDALTTAAFIGSTVRLYGAYSLGSCLKHFPGYGNNADTHTGIARDTRPLAELEEADLIPFAAGMEAGAGAVLVSHTIVDCLDPEHPASLSPAVHTYLRQSLGFEGVILTDDLVMQAITDRYGTGEAAVLAVLAGNDLLCSTDYRTQYQAVYAAVLDGRIDMDTLNRAVRNVLEWKQQLGLIFVG